MSHEEISKELRLLEMPLFILIGPRTFSAAEEFSNNMKVLGRAKLVGEPSRGGANPGDFYPIGEGFIFFVPTGRTVNPLEGGNWEGRGVIPDHMVPAADALDQTIHLAEST
ncbi:MAG: S41 family peptidase [Bacillota bacterium]|nr:S41 family peptidase [Bacillota bacterium]